MDVIAVPITYIRTFALGSHFGRLFLVAPVSTLDASRPPSTRCPVCLRMSEGGGRGSWTRW